jgi:hypothetical protein
VWDCHTYARCELVLVDQRTRRGSRRPAAARTLRSAGGVGTDDDAYGDGLLSPDGTHLAVMADDPDGRFRAHVIELRSGADAVLPGVGTDSNANRQLAWSPNSRWLLGLTDQQIRTYDTRTRAGGTLRLGSEQLLHLTTTHAPAS